MTVVMKWSKVLIFYQKMMKNTLQQIPVYIQLISHKKFLVIYYFDYIYNIAPAKGNNPVRMLQTQGNEAKTFPYHFPRGHFSWNDKRDTRITLSRYFNNRLMNDRFAKDSSYIFFSQYMSDLNQVIEKRNYQSENRSKAYSVVKI